MSENRKVPPLAVLIAVAMVPPVAMNILQPSLPGMVRVFQSDPATVQWTLSLYIIGIGVGQIFYGPLSDYFGRRPVLLAGLMIYTLSSVLTVFAPTVEILIFGRFIQAIGICSGVVLTRAIVRDVFGRAKAASALGYVTMGMAVGPAIAPAMGGILEDMYGWQASLFLLFLLGAAIIPLCLRYIHETNPHLGQRRRPADLVMSFGHLFRSRAFVGYTMAQSFTSGSFFAFLGGAPYVVVNLMGGTPTDYGLYFTIIAIAYMVGNYFSGRMSERLGVDRMVLTGISISFIGMAVMGALFFIVPSQPIAIFAPVAIMSIGHGICIPNAISGAVSVYPRLAGSAAGLLGSLQMGVAAVLSYLGGLLLTGSYLPMMSLMFLSTSLALVGFLMARNAGEAEDESAI
ncbi:MAG: multidrug effflux MFS transporter [Rhodospirillales bacterium]|nr:multidrug effflux MFS transporter [Rhodospirillales bacterium]